MQIMQSLQSCFLFYFPFSLFLLIYVFPPFIFQNHEMSLNNVINRRQSPVLRAKYLPFPIWKSQLYFILYFSQIKNNQPIPISEAEMIPDNVQSSD